MDSLQHIFQHNAIISIDFIQDNILSISLILNVIFILGYLLNKLISIETKPNIYNMLNNLSDIEIEKVIIHLSNRIIIPIYFTKQKIQQFVQNPNTITIMNYDSLWKYLIENNYVLSDDYNEIMNDWIQNITNNYHVTEEELSDVSDDASDDAIDDSDDKNTTNNVADTVDTNVYNKEVEDKPVLTLEIALSSLSYSMLQEYAGVNNKSKSKTQLIEIIIGNFNQIKKKMEDRKLKILNKQLSY